MDPVEALIRKIHAELERVHGSKVKIAVGNLEDKQHNIYPRVAWIEDGGKFEMGPSKEEGIETPAAVLVQRPNVLVKCWGKDLAEARSLAFRAILACSRVQESRASFDRDYNVPPERHGEAGCLLEIRVYLTIEIPIDTEFTRKIVTIQDTEHTLSVNGEQVC